MRTFVRKNISFFFSFPALMAMICLGFTSPIQAQMRITEYMYGGTNGEFVEFTNVGNAPIDMTGWSFDDNDRNPGVHDLSGFGVVQAGESVIVTETDPATFRAAWNLCAGIKVVGGYTNDNLGRSDEINLYDAGKNQVDRLTYNDQGTGTVKAPRTNNISGWVNAAGLGANIATDWTLSTVGDTEGSYASSGGDIGSPGKSTRATVPYNPCSQMRITEFMYSGINGEFVEFTNISSTPVDMTGWSYSDNSRHPGDVPLSAFGTVAPGESVILTETDAATFRTDWALCSTIKVIGGNSIDNLGRGDEVNLYDASNNLSDRLTYDDQSIAGTIQTKNASGWVQAAALGGNYIADWTLATVGDAEGSYKSSGGDIGSPGKSTRATVVYNPCGTPSPDAPTIVMNVVKTSDLLDGGLTTPPASPYAVSGTINDPSDPAATFGIAFTMSDSAVGGSNLTVTLSSSNTTVVPNTGLTLTISDSTLLLKISPAAIGYSNITITVSNGTKTATYVIAYAASQSTASDIKWSTGMADASGAIALDDNYMVVVNDEVNTLFVYRRDSSGLPVTTYDFNQNNILNLTDGSVNNWKEVDVEAATSSPTKTGRGYFLGSMSNSSSFNDKPNRNRIIALDMSSTGAATQFTNVGYYDSLRQTITSWGDSHNYGFSASAAEGIDPKTDSGFNAEGMVFGPDGTTLFIGMRAPLVPVANRTNAVVVPILNFESWFNNGAPSARPTLGAPIELDLGKRGIRDMIRLTNGGYIIAAGSVDGTPNPAVYAWSGNAGDAATPLNSFDLTGINAEGVLQINNSGQMSLNQLQFIADDGGDAFYGDGVEAKDLTEDNLKKFMSVVVTSTDPIALPVLLDYFTATRQNSNVQLSWGTAFSNNITSFEVLRSADGSHFNPIATVAASTNQAAYAYTDVNAPSARLYYRIQTDETSGKTDLSTIRVVNANGIATAAVKVYPNPVVNNVFTIAVANTGVKIVNVYSSAGILYQQDVFSGTSKDISTTGWAKGLYLLKIMMEDGTSSTQEIIVK